MDKMERVRIVQGKSSISSIIVVAPHGVDDERTSIITEKIANKLNCYGVINLGWEKSDKVDFMNDKADCNNVKHCHEDVVKEEFLEPIIRFKNRIIKSGKEAFVFYIHGMSNKHKILANDPTLDIVVGYGVGSPSSLSFDIWKKNMFMEKLEDVGFTTYEASQGSSMSGWSKNNMNQLFRKWYFEEKVNSIQLELVHELRESNSAAERTADHLAEAIAETVVANKFHISGYNRIY